MLKCRWRCVSRGFLGCGRGRRVTSRNDDTGCVADDRSDCRHRSCHVPACLPRLSSRQIDKQFLRRRPTRQQRPLAWHGRILPVNPLKAPFRVNERRQPVNEHVQAEWCIYFECQRRTPSDATVAFVCDFGIVYKCSTLLTYQDIISFRDKCVGGFQV